MRGLTVGALAPDDLVQQVIGRVQRSQQGSAGCSFGRVAADSADRLAILVIDKEVRLQRLGRFVGRTAA